MIEREKIEQILDCARAVDKKYELFGASTHKYKLNPPISASFVRNIEEKYGFMLPEDYFYFITEVADGGAGPDYGIQPFTDFLQEGKDTYSKRYWEEYRCSLAKPFAPRPMEVHEVEEFAIATKEAYEKILSTIISAKKNQKLSFVIQKAIILWEPTVASGTLD